MVSGCGVDANGWHKTSKGMREMNYQYTQQLKRATMLKLPTKTFIGFMRCYAPFLFRMIINIQLYEK